MTLYFFINFSSALAAVAALLKFWATSRHCP